MTKQELAQILRDEASTWVGEHGALIAEFAEGLAVRLEKKAEYESVVPSDER